MSPVGLIRDWSGMLVDGGRAGSLRRCLVVLFQRSSGIYVDLDAENLKHHRMFYLGTRWGVRDKFVGINRLV